MLKKRFVTILLMTVVCVYVSAQVTFAHPWQGKRVAYFGDSITDPNNKGSKIKYWNFLQSWLDITPYVYGVSGRQWNDIPRQADKLLADHGQDVDAILIFVGTNDFNAGVPIGEWWDECDTPVMAGIHKPKAMVARRQRTPQMNPDTYRGRINIALDKVKRMFPDKQIVLLTPLHRAFAEFSDSNCQPDESYQNECGEWVDAYVQSVCEAGRIWAVPVIDWNASSGLFPLHEEGLRYFAKPDTDRLHPNDAGQERLARTLMYQLLTLPCRF